MADATSTSKRSYLIAAAIVAVLVVAIAASWSAGRTGDDGEGGEGQVATGVGIGPDGEVEVPEAPPELAASEAEVGIVRRDESDYTALGDVDAPLVIVEYADYRCPYCGVFLRDTMPELQAEFIDTGLVRFEWRDMPVFGEESIAGAVAARAAGEQGLFWEYHDAMFQDAPERGHMTIDEAAIMGWAEQVGVPDMEAFRAALDDPELRRQVEADRAEGEGLGFAGTPSFVVGARGIFGAQPIHVLRHMIQYQLFGETDEPMQEQGP